MPDGVLPVLMIGFGGSSGPGALDCVSWNIHRGRGQDGRIDPDRTAHVLLSEVLVPRTAVLVLQEADEECRPHRGVLDIGRIEDQSGLRHVHRTEASRWGPDSHGFLGVIVFLAPDIEVQDIALLDLPGHCHRGAVVVDATRGGHAFRVIGTHLSLGQPLRIAQMRVIGQHLRRRSPRQNLLIGDLNEWRPWGGLAMSPRLLGQSLFGTAKASFPVARPILPLDRILTSAPGRVEDMRALDGPGIRIASDHRPVAARVTLGPST
ncbi:endonuclease/exonuclease/phosphatase family protein [Seohaeicola saemankumensis]|uniref:endonuclease/exonuclease/phosphatase family protein n=1 Tax=Seohaeicola TaxID=481178 RepID=UPI0035CFBAB7